MLIGNEFVKAEDKYRREKLRDQNTGKSSMVKVATLATAVAMVLATSGTAIANDADTATAQAVARDDAPAWEPNGDLLDVVLNAEVKSATVVVDSRHLGPSWSPNRTLLEEIVGSGYSEPASGPR